MNSTAEQVRRLHALDRAVIVSMAQHVLEYACTIDPAGSGPGEVSTHSGADSLSCGAGHEDSASVGSTMRWIDSHVAEVLLKNAIKRANNLAESGYMLVRDGQLGVIVARVAGGEIEGIKGAIVEHHGGAGVVELEAPVIRRVITASRERSLGDFVCILCELVCLLGGDLRFNRDTVGLFREVVGLLRSAVAEYTEQQPGDDASTPKASPRGCDLHFPRERTKQALPWLDIKDVPQNRGNPQPSRRLARHAGNEPVDKKEKPMLWKRTKSDNEMPTEQYWHNTIRGMSQAIAERKPFEDDFGLSEAFEEGYKRAVLHMHQDLGSTSTEFNCIVDAAKERAKDLQ